MLNKALLLGASNLITIEFDITGMKGAGATVYRLPLGASFEDVGFSFPDYDFESDSYTNCGMWTTESGESVYESTKLKKSCVLVPVKRKALPPNGSLTMTVTPANYEDTSWSYKHYKYRGYSDGYPTLGSIKTSGSVSFTPDVVYFRVEKNNSTGKISGSIDLDFGFWLNNDKYWFKRKTKVTLSPTPKVSSLNATAGLSKTQFDRYEDADRLGELSTNGVSCSYQYYSLDSWKYTLTWEPVS